MTASMTQDELLAELKARFGDDPMAWAFQCPTCKDVATAADFKAALAEHPRIRRDGEPTNASDLLGQECIGRTLGALRKDQPKWTGRGCDWCAFGLFGGPLEIRLPGGKSMRAFHIAPASVKAGAK